MLQLLPLLTPHLSTPLPPPPKPAERQRCPTPASLPPRPCPTLAYLLAPQTSLGRSVPSSSCPGCLLSLSLSGSLSCPFSPKLLLERGRSPAPFIYSRHSQSQLRWARKGHSTSLRYRPPGRMAGKHRGRRGDPTPSGPNDKPVSPLPGLPSCSLNPSSPTFLPTPHPPPPACPEPATCLARGKSDAP